MAVYAFPISLPLELPIRRDTTIVWERKTGKPTANAIVWQDTRVSDDVHSRRERKNGFRRFAFRQCRYLPPLEPYRRSEGRRARHGRNECRPYPAPKPTNTGWRRKLLAAFEVLRPVLPQMRSSSEVYGEASLPATAGVPIAGIRPVLDTTETS